MPSEKKRWCWLCRMLHSDLFPTGFRVCHLLPMFLFRQWNAAVRLTKKLVIVHMWVWAWLAS